MTPPTTSPLLTLATLNLTAGTVAAPVPGAIVVPDGAPAPDFAAALADLAIAPLTADARPALAVPGKPLPVARGKDAPPAAAPAPLTGATGDDAILLPVAAKSDGETKDQAGQQAPADDDPALDPALCWLMPPVATAPVVQDRPTLAGERVAVRSAAPTVPVTDSTAIQPPVVTVEAPEIAATSPAPTVAAEAIIATPGELPVTTARLVGASPILRRETGNDAPPAAALPPATAASATPAAPIIPFAPPPPSARAETIAATAPLAPVGTRDAAPAIATPVPLAPAAPPASAAPDSAPVAVAAPPVIAAAAPVEARAAVPRTETPARVDPLLAASQPAAPAPLVSVPSAAPRPAAEVFAEALAAPAPRRGALQPLGDLAGAALAATAAPTSPIAVQQTGGAQQAGIDLTRDPGIHRMIDHIEHLRDAADARDTRIRLIPDSLGPVDVSVRQDGERITVHFTAEQATTRTLIADAQPRLTEIAEARGVRIAQTTVDAGTGGNQPRPQPQSAPATPAAPPRAAAETEDTSDARVA